jgi:outer membrane protein assembly factor BamB
MSAMSTIKLYALNAAEGGLEWTFSQSPLDIASPVFLNGRIYTVGSDSRGYLYELDARRGSCSPPTPATVR